MSRNGKVVVAMSGGVDSSVAACLLRQQGYDCVGVFMRVGAAQDEPQACAVGDTTAPPRRLKHGCCSATDAMDARAIAGRLGIPFYALNFEADFGRIIDYFVDEYGRARTPNPCVMCNIHLKFGKLLRYADMLGAEFVATGHYARTFSAAEAQADFRFSTFDFRLEDSGPGPTGQSKFENRTSKIFLARARNVVKDQSYVLFGIRREDLPRCRFPLGDFADKAEVRRIAAELGLRVHDKPDSQEICFVPNQDYRGLIRRRRPELLRAGEFRDSSGRVVGRHEGVAAYTIGQRHGLGLALGKPVYVRQLDVLSNSVTIGGREELDARGLVASDMNWFVDLRPSGERRPPNEGEQNGGRCPPYMDGVHIKIRHMHTPAAGRLRVLDTGDVEGHFDEPQTAVTPGQAAVFYAGDIVLGGGWIARSLESIEP